MILRKTDLTPEAQQLGLWDALLSISGYSPKEHDCSDELEISIIRGNIIAGENCGTCIAKSHDCKICNSFSNYHGSGI